MEIVNNKNMHCKLAQMFIIVVEDNKIDKTVTKKREKNIFFFKSFRLTVLQDALWAL